MEISFVFLSPPPPACTTSCASGQYLTGTCGGTSNKHCASTPLFTPIYAAIPHIISIFRHFFMIFSPCLCHFYSIDYAEIAYDIVLLLSPQFICQNFPSFFSAPHYPLFFRFLPTCDSSRKELIFGFVFVSIIFLIPPPAACTSSCPSGKYLAGTCSLNNNPICLCKQLGFYTMISPDSYLHCLLFR